VPWWERGRAAGVQREAAQDDKPRWWEKSRTIDEIAGRALSATEIDRAVEEIYRRTDLTARGTFGDFCARNGMSREEVIEIFRLNKPDCTYRFSAHQEMAPRRIDLEQRLRDMYEAVDPITGESWADYCRRCGITRADMVASIRSLARVDWPHESIRQSREREPTARARSRGYDRER
jgi:hypothetical protein